METLDLTFSDDGKQVTDILADWDYAQSVTLQPDGKSLLPGAPYMVVNRFALARYNPDGTWTAHLRTGIANTTFTIRHTNRLLQIGRTSAKRKDHRCRFRQEMEQMMILPWQDLFQA